ncbi:aryl-alcohol dehydrogenase-like predicted oxidoreductase [Nonomuraea thailandensis]|uniref:Aryl-alcohol dehydrogenase-like predicted oxidoreductase n=1 Tax=Nonomuraea thailandensis TaxID=1188745 RepID=A0A9X2GT20_9ACTN|nr:aldo/keto reductase [Nonomuraea thailandensis]MCP2365024.1 aryl-alcohol dehydrogenase-like predicted oxidoreductase [Nonomuraea thailandensis]
MNIALGTIPFGTAVDLGTTFAILDRFVEAGGTRIDTANNYPFWVEGCTGDESEQAIGAWLAARGNRDEVFISTKVGARPTVPGAVTLDSAEGLSAATIAEAAEGSLTRLRTDYIDVYWSHIEDRSVPFEETLRAFDELAQVGKVRAIGASNMPAWRLERARNVSAAHGLTPYTYVQQRHTYLRPRPGAKLPESGHTLVSDDLLGYLAAEPDLTLWAYNTLMFGAYTRPDRPVPEVYDHPGTTRRLKVLQEVADELGATRNQVVLAWLMADGIVPIVGVSTMEQLEEAIGAAELKLDEDARARMDAAA